MSQFCYRCDKLTETKVVAQGDRTSYRCAICDWEVDCDYDEDELDDDYEDEWDWTDECGLLPEHLGGGCQLAGSEFCDFECPYRNAERLIDEAEAGDA